MSTSDEKEPVVTDMPPAVSPSATTSYHPKPIEAPTFVIIYVGFLALCAMGLLRLLINSVAAVAVFGVDGLGKLLLRVDDFPGLTSSEITVRNVGLLYSTMSISCLLALLAGLLFTAIGIGKMKEWARWLLIGVHTILLLLALLVGFLAAGLKLVPAVRDSLELPSILFYVFASIGVSAFIIRWLARYREWDKTWP